MAAFSPEICACMSCVYHTVIRAAGSSLSYMFPCLMRPVEVTVLDPVSQAPPVELFALHVEEEEARGFCGIWQSVWPSCCLHFTRPDPRLRGCTLPNKLK